MAHSKADLKRVTEQALEKFLTRKFTLKQILEFLKESGLDESQQKEAFKYVQGVGLSTFDTQIFDEASKMHNQGKSYEEIENYFKKLPVYEDIHQLVSKTLKHLGKQNAEQHTQSNTKNDSYSNSSHNSSTPATNDRTSSTSNSESPNPSSANTSTPNKHHYGWVIFIIVALAVGLFTFGKIKNFF